MQAAESRAVRRATVLLAVASVLRWGVEHRPVPDDPGEGESDVLDALTDSVEVATVDAARRSTALASGERIDPNRATEVELDRLPGVGPSTAAAIVATREDGVRFRRPDDLLVVRGIGPSLVARLGPHLDLSAPPSAPTRRRRPSPGIDINRADAPELERLPGVGPAIARRIVDRRGKRLFRSVDELLEVRGIGPATLERLRPHAVVGRRR